MLKIRLQRVGRKNFPSFRVVLTDSKNSTKSGKFKEILGSHSFTDKKTEIDGERIKYWISQGAKATPTLHNLLIDKKIITGEKINVLPRKTAPKKEEVKNEVPAQETPAAEAPEAPKAEEKPVQ